MNRPHPEVLVCTEGDAVCVRLRGRADVSMSVAFKTLLTRLSAQAFRQYEMELSECQIMDSTFLGVLCGFAARREQGGGSRPILLNANERISGLVRSLGVDDLFELCRGLPAVQDHCVAMDTGETPPSRVILKETSLEAHRTLIALNPDNRARFKELTEFLAADLKKLKSNP